MGLSQAVLAAKFVMTYPNVGLLFIVRRLIHRVEFLTEIGASARL